MAVHHALIRYWRLFLSACSALRNQGRFDHGQVRIFKWEPPTVNMLFGPMPAQVLALVLQWAADVAAARQAEAPAATAALQGCPEQPFHAGFRLLVSGRSAAAATLAAFRRAAEAAVVHFAGKAREPECTAAPEEGPITDATEATAVGYVAAADTVVERAAAALQAGEPVVLLAGGTYELQYMCFD